MSSQVYVVALARLVTIEAHDRAHCQLRHWTRTEIESTRGVGMTFKLGGGGLIL